MKPIFSVCRETLHVTSPIISKFSSIFELVIEVVPLINNQTNFSSNWKPQNLQTEATTFPTEAYTDESIYQLEQQQIFAKNWYYVGHVSQLQGFGSYFTVEIAEQPLVIVQDKGGKLQGFFRWDWLLVPDTPVAKSPENLEPLIKFFDNIQQEDLRLLPAIQQRIKSLGYHPGRLSPTREVGTHLFQELVRRSLTQA